MCIHNIWKHVLFEIFKNTFWDTKKSTDLIKVLKEGNTYFIERQFIYIKF